MLIDKYVENVKLDKMSKFGSKNITRGEEVSAIAIARLGVTLSSCYKIKCNI